MGPMHGTIKRLIRDKECGFIASDDGEEYFFRFTACDQATMNELREGRVVVFATAPDRDAILVERVRVE